MPDYYGTPAGADAYIGTPTWEALTEDQKKAALRAASAYVDAVAMLPVPGRAGCRYVLTGKKVGGAAQVLNWPRTGAVDADGDELPQTVPLQVEYATYQAAAYAGANPAILMPTVVQSQQVTREKVGPLEQSYASSTDSSLPPYWQNVPMLPSVLAAMGAFLVVRCGRGFGVLAA